MITNKEITEYLTQVLDSSAALSNYTQSKYGKDALLLVGIDTQNPPLTNDYPIIAISPLVNEMSDSNTNYDYQIVVHLMIKGNDTPSKDGNIIRYLGVYDIEDMGNIVVEELKNNFCKTNLDSYDITFYLHEIEIFPVYTGAVVINFSVPNVIGETKLNLGV